MLIAYSAENLWHFMFTTFNQDEKDEITETMKALKKAFLYKNIYISFCLVVKTAGEVW